MALKNIGGRPLGSTSAVKTASAKLAKKFLPSTMEALHEITKLRPSDKGYDPKATVMAANTIIERAEGKVPTTVQGGGDDRPIRITISKLDEKL